MSEFPFIYSSFKVAWATYPALQTVSYLTLDTWLKNQAGEMQRLDFERVKLWQSTIQTYQNIVHNLEDRLMLQTSDDSGIPSGILGLSSAKVPNLDENPAIIKLVVVLFQPFTR